MEERRRRHAQGPVEQQLPGGGPQEIGAAHDLGDPHRGVIDHTGQLIGRDVILPPDHKVAKINARREPLPTAITVHKLDRLASGTRKRQFTPGALRGGPSPGGCDSATTGIPIRNWP